MQSILDALLIVSIMFGFYFGWNTHCRKVDLVKNLNEILSELHEDEYEAFLDCTDGARQIELSNSTTRIQYKRDAIDETIICSRFFESKESSGANTTVLSRAKISEYESRKIAFLRTNALMGTLLYHRGGYVHGTKNNKLFTDIRDKIIERWKSSYLKKCSSEAIPADM